MGTHSPGVRAHDHGLGMTFGSHSAHSSLQPVTGASSGPGRVRFDLFEADLRTGELFRQGKRVALPNQSFLALAALLEQPGQVVSRDELRARLWPDERVVEFDQGLNASMNRLREALGDSAGQPRFVETLPRRGYRFIGTVHPDPVPPGTGAAADARAVPVRMYGLAVLLSEEALGPGLAATPQGSAFVRERQRVELWRVDLTSAADSGGALVDASSSQLVPEYSPDGARVVFQSGRSGSPEIWLADSDGHNPRQLTAFKGPLTG